MIRSKGTETFNGVKQVSKTADYTILVTDEVINVTPALNTVLTLPAISTLAAAGFGAKAYKIVKEGTGRYSVEIAVGSSEDAIMGSGVNASSIFLTGRSEAVVIQSDPVSKKWLLQNSNVAAFIEPSLDGGKFLSQSLKTDDLTGQINGIEINMTGPDGAATGSNSYSVMRINNFMTGTNIMTARTGFMGLYFHSAVQALVGNCTVLELELGEAAALGSQTSAILTLCTRSARPSASYHELSAYITIRDYSTGSGGPIPSVLSFQNATLGWTIPTNSATAPFTTYSTDIVSTHALKIDVGGVPYWIPAIATAPH